MDDWEEARIDKNLPELIKHTKCTTQVKSLLRARGFVTEEEVEILTAVGDNHGAQREAKALYGILQTRQGAYEAVMSALEETRQTGALDILKTRKKYPDSEGSEETLVDKFMKIPVELFGSLQILSQHVAGLKKETVLELLNCENVQNEVAELIKSDTTLKLTPDLPELHALYIPRAISNRLLLDPQIFKRSCPDIFVFKGIDPRALVDLVSPHVIRLSTTQLSVITCRHIHLDDDEDWDDLVLVTKAPLHLVYKDADGYILQRSTQVTSILHEHWLNKSRKRDAYVSEDKFAFQFINENRGKGALICDVPGMGKSWLMQSIARRVQLLASRTTVFFIQLDSFAKYLAKQNGDYDGIGTLNQVLQFVYDRKLAACILSVFVEKNTVNLVFVFDGFDEVSQVHIDIMTVFLKKLVRFNYVRFIISSRPNMRAHLEKTFNLVSFDILPFGKQEQIASIVNRWQETIPEGDDKKLSKLASQCIDSFKVVSQMDRNDILGVPLQCYVLAMVNETKARQVCDPNRRKDFVVHEIAKVESICELYTLFFNGLAHKCFAEQTSGETCNIKTVERFHTQKALELLFPEIAPVFLKSFKNEIEIEDFAIKWGVLCQSRQSKLEFIHRSFAEFLAGKFFAEFWTDVKSHDPMFVQSVGSYFIINVMKPPGEIQYPKMFLDYEDGLFPRIPKDVVFFSCSTVLWFMNSLYRMKPEENGNISIFADTLGSQQRLLPVWRRLAASIGIQKDTFTLCKENVRKYSYINIIGCVNHEFSSLLSMLVSLIKVFFKDTERLALLRVPFLFKTRSPNLPFLLCYIADFGCPENASKVFDLFGGSPQNFLLKFCLNYPDKFWTPLEVAIARKNLEMVLFFNQKIKKNDERLWRVFLECLKYTNADMNVNIRIMETVFGSASKFFSCLSVQKFELFDRYVSIVNLINLAWACKCSLTHASAEYKKYLLKRILGIGTDEEYIKLLLLLFPNEQRKRFCVPDESMTNFSFNVSECTGKAVLQNVSLDGIKMALPNDLSNISPKIRNVETLKILIGITPNCSSWNKYAHNYLHEAAFGGKAEWVEHLIECGYDINERDKNCNTPLHYVRFTDRGVEMTQILVNNGADAYAVNNEKRNFSHYVFSGTSRYWSSDEFEALLKWVKYLMEAGLREIWRMKDFQGKTPQDLLSNKLGTSHPITQEILTLLQTEGIICTS